MNSHFEAKKTWTATVTVGTKEVSLRPERRALVPPCLRKRCSRSIPRGACSKGPRLRGRGAPAPHTTCANSCEHRPAHMRATRAHGAVVSHPLCMRKALGSIPSVSTFLTATARRPTASCTRQPARGKPRLDAWERVPHRPRWREPNTSTRISNAASVAHAPGLHHCCGCSVGG